MRKRKIVQTRVMVIVHGKSEYLMCKSVFSNLKIPHKIHSKNKGKNSIQINGLSDEINRKFFTDLKRFAEENNIEYSKGKLIDFKLFIIMDLDDCSPENAYRYKNKEMFKKHALYDYIVPVYNDPDLEKTMKNAGIPVNKKKKTRDYFEIFPTDHGDLDRNIALEYYKKLKKCKNSNLYEFFEYCIKIAENMRE